MCSVQKNFRSIMQTQNTCTTKNVDENILSCNKVTPVSISSGNGNFYQQYENLKNKPNHWTLPYWENVTSTYKWFIHKDGYVGCSLCKINNAFPGKKSLIASMMLLLSEFSYEEFEKKLVEHEFSIHHGKSLSLYRGFLQMSNNIDLKDVMPISPALINKKCDRLDFSCPLCNKGYRMKSALIKHIKTCDNKFNPKGFLSPCGCKGYIFYSIFAIDDHCSKEHPGKYVFNCKMCKKQFEKLTSLYAHMLESHDYPWNPYEYIPTVSEIPVDIINIPRRLSRRETLKDLDEQSRKFECREHSLKNEEKLRSRSSIKSDDSLKRFEDVENVKPIVMKSKKGMSKKEIRDREKMKRLIRKKSTPLNFSLENIHICKYCAGRYLSQNVLTEHITNRHAKEVKEENNKDDRNSSVMKILGTEILSAVQDKHDLVDKETSTESDIEFFWEVNVNACLLSCPLCQEPFSNLHDRSSHVSKVHPEIEPFICPHCGIILMNCVNYNRHLENTHKCNSTLKPKKNSYVATYSCTDCPLVFTNQVDLNNHRNLSHNEDSVLAALVSADHREDSCFCPICEIVLHNRFELAIHSFSHSENPKNFDFPSCPNCYRLFFGDFRKLFLKDHYNFEHLKKSLPTCSFCWNTFPNSYCLLGHRIKEQCLSEVHDPYLPLESLHRLAFSCCHCGGVFAGQDSRSRFEKHFESCVAQLMSEERLL